MHEAPVLNFIDAERAHRRIAKTTAELDLVAWLRRQARDRQPDGVRGGPFWYLAAVRPGDEIATAIRLMRDRIRAFCPRERVVEKLPRGKGKKVVRRPMYPGYIFVLLSPGEPCWAGVLTYDGVHRLVPSSDRPSRMHEAAMAQIIRIARKRPHKKAKAPALFVVGDEVLVTDGPFDGFGGTVMRPDDAHGRMRVEVAIFGRVAPVDLDLDQVRKLR
ncbi:transcription termination/antitermination protein NusG [Nitratireductor pacificus]|uniref:Transcription termination/antitermination protein NusG n=1 Tax=Nitratireductor pacificus pht-3B TaxID=391937 RepID=K2MYN3_9HYPH|nr:transcription termination/antitermination NusG family protein [Nitratireductor pacificus]EKF17078.1 transcription antitermination protein NusG [Nitratireductor pacificus pht-3B]